MQKFKFWNIWKCLLYEIWEYAHNKKPNGNWLISSTATSSWRFCKTLKKKKTKEIFPFVWLYLKSIFTSSDSFCFILSYVLCGTKIKIHCVWIIDNMCVISFLLLFKLSGKTDLKWHTNRQTDRKTYWQIDRQTNRQTDKQTDRPTDRPTDRQTDTQQTDQQEQKQ